MLIAKQGHQGPSLQITQRCDSMTWKEAENRADKSLSKPCGCQQLQQTSSGTWSQQTPTLMYSGQLSLGVSKEGRGLERMLIMGLSSSNREDHLV